MISPVPVDETDLNQRRHSPKPIKREIEKPDMPAPKGMLLMCPGASLPRVFFCLWLSSSLLKSATLLPHPTTVITHPSVVSRHEQSLIPLLHPTTYNHPSPSSHPPTTIHQTPCPIPPPAHYPDP